MTVLNTALLSAVPARKALRFEIIVLPAAGEGSGAAERRLPISIFSLQL